MSTAPPHPGPGEALAPRPWPRGASCSSTWEPAPLALRTQPRFLEEQGRHGRRWDTLCACGLWSCTVRDSVHHKLLLHPKCTLKPTPCLLAGKGLVLKPNCPTEQGGRGGGGRGEKGSGLPSRRSTASWARPAIRPDPRDLEGASDRCDGRGSRRQRAANGVDCAQRLRPCRPVRGQESSPHQSSQPSGPETQREPRHLPSPAGGRQAEGPGPTGNPPALPARADEYSAVSSNHRSPGAVTPRPVPEALLSWSWHGSLRPRPEQTPLHLDVSWAQRGPD